MGNITRGSSPALRVAVAESPYEAIPAEGAHDREATVLQGKSGYVAAFPLRRRQPFLLPIVHGVCRRNRRFHGLLIPVVNVQYRHRDIRPLLLCPPLFPVYQQILASREKRNVN